MVKEEGKHKRSEISSKDEPVVWRDTRLRDGRHVDVFATEISDARGLVKSSNKSCGFVWAAGTQNIPPSRSMNKSNLFPAKIDSLCFTFVPVVMAVLPSSRR